MKRSLDISMGASVVWCAASSAHLANQGAWLMFTIVLSAGLLNLSLLIYSIRRDRGSRKAREDHRSGSARDARTSTADDTRTSERTRTGLTVPKETSAEPIQAWKVARLCVEPSGRGVMLGSLNDGYRHPIEGNAECAGLYAAFVRNFRALGEEYVHGATPSLDCTCGFYAWKDRERAEEMIGYKGFALLQVELFGTVIQHENGYRAGKQRVLGVFIDSRCNSFMCHTPAQFIEFPDDAPQFKVWCGDHKQGSRVCTIQEVANYLRCEARWTQGGAAQ